MNKKIFFIILFFNFSLIIFSQENTGLNISIFSNNEHFKESAPGISIKINEPKNEKELTNAVKVFLLITILSLAPSIFILCTSFIRIIIVLTLLRQAIGLPQLPPNQILIGFAIFLTFFNMTPVIQEINKNALEPYRKKLISWDETIEEALKPVKKFMLKQTRDEDLAVFLQFLKNKPQSRKDLPISIIIPAFVLSELKTGFTIGFIIYIPFLIVDIIVSSIILSIGMVMLPPVMISLPFKILLFVLIDGWKLITETLIKSFY